MKLIEVKNLTFSYDKKVNVIDGVSFCVESGKYISIIGHNGSGKSTFAKLLIGLLEAQKGEIKAFGLDLNSENVAEIRRKIGIVFQNPDNQFVGTTVRDDIAFGLENRCVPQEKMDGIINEFAKKVHMEEFLDKAPENLSGGQKQRVAIAGVLALSPEVVIFDEASSMLDPRGKREVRECIEEMRKENPNLSILSITHDLEEAFSSDEIIVLQEGKVVAQGKPENLLEKPEIFAENHLDLPFKNKLVEELKKQGINVSSTESIERIVEELCQ
jgi:energy-coupling factor transport system ATP-binding protein